MSVSAHPRAVLGCTVAASAHCPHRTRRVALALAALMLGLAAAMGSARAAEPVPAPPQPMFTMKVVANGLNPYASPGEAPMLPATLHFRGAQSRIDFTGPDGQRGVLVHDAASNTGWLLDVRQGIALPIKSPGFRGLKVDPQHPCAHLDVRCKPGRSRFIAGQAVRGWRYRDAGGHGPGGTSDGVFWADPAHGVVLAYRGTKRGWDQVYEMRALSVSYADVPKTLFKLPKFVTVVDDGHARQRSADQRGDTQRP